eukprot:5667056-Amphidinium_carterae.3
MTTRWTCNRSTWLHTHGQRKTFPQDRQHLAPLSTLIPTISPIYQSDGHEPGPIPHCCSLVGSMPIISQLLRKKDTSGAKSACMFHPARPALAFGAHDPNSSACSRCCLAAQLALLHDIHALSTLSAPHWQHTVRHLSEASQPFARSQC